MRDGSSFFCLLTAALFVAGFGAASFPAIAQLRVITIKLVGGQRITTTVDVPPGTPLDQIQLPEITAPIEGIEEAAPKTPDAQPDPRHEQGPEEQATQKHEAIEESQGEPQPKPDDQQNTQQDQGGTPDSHDPTLSIGLPGPAPIGVPNFIINKFRIPPFLLPLYQAAGVQYGIRWEVLAAINEIETDYGRNLNVSSAGAVGWMQFLPSSWRTYGVDANTDGQKDPYNPVDAIFAAGRYLKAAGGDKNVRRAIFAYNHADWYVDSVMMRARMIAGLPADVVGSLTGLTQGHFPVHANARYADDLAAKDLAHLSRKVRREHNAAKLVESRDSRRSINVFSRRGAPVIAVNDGVVKKVGVSERVGRYIVLQDVYGNRYLYAHLGEVSKRYPVPRERSGDVQAATSSTPLAHRACPSRRARERRQAGATAARPHCFRARSARAASSPPVRKERLFANPARQHSAAIAQETGQLSGVLSRSGSSRCSACTSRACSASAPTRSSSSHSGRARRSWPARSSAAWASSPSGPGSKLAPHLNFSIRPAGRGAPRIDPKPILDGWKLLEATAVYRAAGTNPFLGSDADRPMRPDPSDVEGGARSARARQPADRRLPLRPPDIRSGQIDRRVLATLEFLAASGLRPTVTSLKCGHGFYTASGNVSEHSSGTRLTSRRSTTSRSSGTRGPDRSGTSRSGACSPFREPSSRTRSSR